MLSTILRALPSRLLPLCLLLSFGACRSAPRPVDAPESSNSGALEVKNPDVYTSVSGGWADEVFDPAANYTVPGGAFILAVYDALLVYDGESMDTFKPLLASEVPSQANGLIRDSGRTYVFPIRREPRFQAGPIKDASGKTIPGSGELSPEDLAYTFHRGMLADPAGGPQWLLLSPLVGTTSILDLARRLEEAAGGRKAADVTSLADVSPSTLDAVCKTVKEAVTVEGDSLIFHLKEPYAPFLQLMVGPWAVALDKEWVAAEIKDASGQVTKKAGWNGDCATWTAFYGRKSEDSELHHTTNGTGAYVMERWVPNEGATLRRNDAYWRGPGRLKQVVFRKVPEFSTRLLMLQAGDADVIEIPGANIDQVQPLVAQGIVREVKMTSARGMNFIALNQQVNPDDNPYIGSGKLDGQGIPPDFFTDIDVRKGFNYALDWDKLIQEAWNGDAVRAKGPMPSNVNGFDPTWPSYDHDPEKAEAHFRKAWGGRLWDTGFKVLLPGDPSQPNNELQLIKQSLAAINPKFQVELHPVVGQQGWEDRVGDRLALAFDGWVEDFHDADDWAQPIFGTGGYFNVIYGFPPDLQQQFDNLILQGRRELDSTKRAAIYSRIGLMSYEQALLIPGVEPRNRSFERSWLQGVVRNPARWDQDFHAMYKAIAPDR